MVNKKSIVRGVLLSSLVMLKWLSEVMFFFGQTIMITAATFTLLHIGLKIPLEVIYNWSVIALFSYLALGLLTIVFVKGFGINRNFLVIATSIAYLILISNNNFLTASFWRTPQLAMYAIVPYLLVLVYRYIFKKLIYLITFKQVQEISLEGISRDDLELNEKIMLAAIQNTLKVPYKSLIHISKTDLKRDVKGYIQGEFSLHLDFWLIVNKPKFMNLALVFNLNDLVSK